MPLDPQQVAPGNRIKYNNQESDVVDRLRGESGNTYIVLASPDNAKSGLRILSVTAVAEDEDAEFVSTTAEAKDPERAKAAEAQAQKDKDLAEYDAKRSEFLKWQESQRTPVQANVEGAPTDPTVPTKK